MKIKKCFKIAVLAVLLFFIGFVNNQAKAVTDVGNYIHVKLDPDDMGLDDFWEFRSVDGNYGNFNVSATDYSLSVYECALFITQENGGMADSIQILWIANEENIARSGSSLSNSIGSYSRCCIEGGLDTACSLTTSMDTLCDWDPSILAGPKDVFERAYSAGWDDMTGDYCDLAVSETHYRPKTDLLCETTWKQCGAAEASCKDYNARTYACKNGNWTKCTGTATPDCNTGVCVAAATTTMNLTVSASDNPLMTNDTTTVTFRTKESDGTNINGAAIDVTSVSCGTLPDPATTTSAGSTTSTFSSGASAEICTINVKATHDNYDDVTETYIITVQGSDCFNDYRLWFDEDDYVVGDTLSLYGKVFAGGDDSMLCLYKGNTEKDSLILIGGSFPTKIDLVNVSAGTWKGGLFKNETGSCGSYASADCQTETIVIVAAGPPLPPPCTTIWGPWTACAGVPGTQTSSNIGTCVVSDKSRLCCNDDSNCVDPLVCNPAAGPAGECVQCMVSDDCAANEVCDSGSCIPCSGEGVAETDPLLCCSGLNIIDGVCTSACDPNASFFCNPLRQSVETLVEGGEKMIGYILGLIGSVALLLVIIAGIMYMTSAGNEEKIASSKKILTGAVIGLGIALLAFSLLQVVLSVLNM